MLNICKKYVQKKDDNRKVYKIHSVSISFPDIYNTDCDLIKDYIKVGLEYKQNKLKELIVRVMEALTRNISKTEGIRFIDDAPIEIYSSWANCGYFVGSNDDQNGNPTTWEYQSCVGEAQCCYRGRIFMLPDSSVMSEYGWIKSSNNSFCDTNYKPNIPPGKTRVTKCGHICGNENKK